MNYIKIKKNYRLIGTIIIFKARLRFVGALWRYKAETGWVKMWLQLAFAYFNFLYVSGNTTGTCIVWKLIIHITIWIFEDGK